MALCKFGHVSLVNKISQKLLKLEPWNLMNRLVAMSRWPDYAPSFEWNWWGILFCLHLSVRLFVRSSSFFCACHILRTLHARVLKFYIWVPNEKIADPYFVSCLACLFKVMPLWKKSELNLVSKIQYSSGKRTKKLFIPNIGVSRTCQKHSESNRVNVIFGRHHSQVRRMYALCEVMRSYTEWKYYTPEAIFLAKRCEIPRSNLTKYLSDFYIFIYLFNKVI